MSISEKILKKYPEIDVALKGGALAIAMMGLSALAYGISKVYQDKEQLQAQLIEVIKSQQEESRRMSEAMIKIDGTMNNQSRMIENLYLRHSTGAAWGPAQRAVASDP